MNMEQEKTIAADAEEARNHEIRVSPLTKEQLKIVQEQKKMRKAMKMIEDAARENEEQREKSQRDWAGPSGVLRALAAGRLRHQRGGAPRPLGQDHGGHPAPKR